MQAVRPLFGSRREAGARLAARASYGRAPVVIALTWGGVEVGYPVAMLDRGPLWRVDARLLEQGGRWLDGLDAVLADDGLLPGPTLIGAVSLLRAACPRRLTVVAPFVPASWSLEAPIAALRRDRPAGAPLYAQGAPDAEAARRCVIAVAASRGALWPPDLRRW